VAWSLNAPSPLPRSAWGQSHPLCDQSCRKADGALQVQTRSQQPRPTLLSHAQSAERFFAALKNEMYYRRSWPTRARARFAVAEYIEVFYNRRRLHSTLGYRTPFEALTNHRTAAVAA
jgi:putative transposase